MKKHKKARGKKRDRKDCRKFKKFNIILPLRKGISAEEEEKVFMLLVKAAQESFHGDLLKIEAEGFRHYEHQY
jgi:hypothetical protein